MKVSYALMCLFAVAAGSHAASHNKMVMVNQYDLDGDWALYLEEFQHARERRFFATDTDNDGLVNKQEYLFEYQNRLDTQMANDRKGHTKQTRVRFAALDKDDDQRMQWQEYEASGKRSFNRYDVNQDGQIDVQDPEPVNYWQKKQKATKQTLQQLEQQRKRRLAWAKVALRMPSTHRKKGMFRKYDTDGDGVITYAEHRDRRKQDFDRTDEDSNGWVNEDEYVLEYQNRLDRQAEKIRKAAVKQTYVRFNALDKNADGQISLQEYHASGKRMFERADLDKNGIVTMAEVEAKNATKTTKKSAKKAIAGAGKESY